MSTYRMYAMIDGIQLQRKLGEASGDYPAQWSVLGTYPDIEAAKRVAEAYEKRLKEVEYLKTVPPIEFDL